MKTFVSPDTISPDLVRKIRDLHRKILPLPEMMRTFSGKGGGAAALLIPINCPSVLHLCCSSPSKPGFRYLPFFKPFLVTPLSQGPSPRASPPPSPASHPHSQDKHQTESLGGLFFIRAQKMRRLLQSQSSYCSQDTTPLGVLRGMNVTDLSVSASLRKLGASSGNRFR